MCAAELAYGNVTSRVWLQTILGAVIGTLLVRIVALAMLSMATENCTLLAAENCTLRGDTSRAERTFSR